MTYCVNSPPPTPAIIYGSLERAGDVDLFRFAATVGEKLTLEVNAAPTGSKLDSRLEILTMAGTLIEQVVLQATREVISPLTACLFSG